MAGASAGSKNTLNVARDLEVVIESLLFVRHRIDDGVVERKGGLLGDRFEDDEIAFAKTARPLGHWRARAHPGLVFRREAVRP